MATIRLNWSVELRIVLGDSVEHDHELTENTTQHTDDRFAFLAPTVSISDLLLQYLIDGLDPSHEFRLNLLAKRSNCRSFALGSPGFLAGLPRLNLILLGLFLSIAFRLNTFGIGFDCLAMRVLCFCHIVPNQGLRVVVVRVHLSYIATRRVKQPRQNILLQDLLLEAITEHAYVA